MRSLRAALRRELRRLGRDRSWIAFAVVMPLAAVALLALIFVREVPQELPVAVADLDGSTTSRRLTRMLDLSPAIRVVRVGGPSDAEAAVVRGGAYAAVLIPRHLERSLRRGEHATVVCAYNAQMLLPANLARKAVRTAVGTLSAGIELRMRNARGATTPQARAQFEPVRLDVHTLFNPRLSYVLFLLMTLAGAVFQVSVVVATIWTAGVELRDGTSAEWLAAAGGPLRALAAKAIPSAVLFTFAFAAAELLLAAIFELPLRTGFQLLAGCALFVLASVAGGLAIALVTANLRFGLTAGAFFTGPALAFGGITFPLAGMPPVARAWSGILPLTHLIEILAGALRGRVPAGPFVAMTAILLVCLGTAVLSARRVIGNPAFEGRR